MAFLTNKWTKYFTRSYQHIKNEVLTTLWAKVPEMTDHTESNLFVKIVSIFSGIAEMLGYYIDNAAREFFIASARRYKSLVSMATLMDYRIMGCNPAEVLLTFTLDSVHGTDITIPPGVQVSDGSGIIFTTVQSIYVPAGDLTAVVQAQQYEAVINRLLAVSDGTESQRYTLGTNVVEGSVSIRVNSLTWTPQNTLGYSSSSSTHFVTSVDKNKNVYVRFGDDVNGKIPAASDVIEYDLFITEAENGNVDAGTINTVVSYLPLPVGRSMTVINDAPATNGTGVESIAELKKHIPLYVRTLGRAVTRQDHIDIAELASGVAAAGVEFECGKYADIYVVPDGGGIAGPVLLSSVETWFEDKKILGMRVRAFPAGEVIIEFEIVVRVRPGFIAANVSNAVRDALIEELSYLNQEIKGNVQIGDMYQLIEAVDGVQSSTIIKFTPKPYARPLSTSTIQLNWDRSISAASVSTIAWRIIMLTPTTFQLFKAGQYKGVYSVGVPVAYPELTFKVNAGGGGGYLANYSWEFYTYPYEGNILLQENSLPVANASNIFITTLGGK